MNSVASPTQSPAGVGGAKLTVTDTTSVDTSGSLIDTPPHQQDSGSNQSGSDSGLGYTNTVSDTSFDPKDARNVLGIEASRASSVLLPQDNGTTVLANNNRQNRIKTTNSCLIPAFNQKNNNSESACSTSIASSKNNHNKPVALEGKARAVTNFSSQTNKSSSFSSSPYCESSSRLPNIDSGTSSETGIVTQQNNNERIFPDKRSKKLLLQLHQNELVPSLSPNTCSPSMPSEPTASVLKSLLKKPTNSASRDKLSKHNRNVSFNQTVIVFCEEIVTSSSPSTAANGSGVSAAEQPESQAPTSPPQLDDYQNYKHTLFETSDRHYCDAENSTNQLVNIGLERAIGESANNLDDKRLFSLLEDESLLESFPSHLDDCEDLSDDDFPENSLNYLSIDAIFDYDSDSESSSIVVRKDLNDFSTTGVPKTTNLYDIGKYRHPKKSQENETRISNKENKDTHTVKLPLPVEHKHQPAKIANQKLMPARMKITPVDVSLTENQFRRRRDSDLTSKSSSKSINNDRYSTHVIRKPDIHSTSKIFERSPVEFKTQQNPPPEEQQYSNLQEINDLPKDYSLKTPNTSQLTRPASDLQRQVDYRPAISSHQPDEITPNSKPPPSTCCQICQLLESKKSIPNTIASTVASRPQPTINDEAGTSLARTSHNNAQLDQTNNSFNSLPLPNGPTVLSQSCISCRELSLKQAAHQSTVTSSQLVAPVACQVVYLVDQKGNRIKALSVIRTSTQNGATNTNQTYRQIYVPTSNIILPNNSTESNQFVKLDNNQSNCIASSFVTTSNSQNSSHPAFSAIQMQSQPSKLVNARKQLVYYIRQPLDSQARLTVTTGDHNNKSFPDAHQIRRLDGVKGPTSVINLMNRETDNSTYYSEKFNELSDSSTNPSETVAKDLDDPTFGFSQRPSVKVVANFIKPPQDFVAPHSLSQSAKASAGVFTNECSHHNVKGSSSYMSNSQTLDRRINQAVIKEALPSTSSMNNISKAFPTLPSQIQVPDNYGTVMKNNGNESSTNSHRPKISLRLSRWLQNKLFN